MLNYSEVATLIKPCLALNFMRMALFMSIGIFLIAAGQVAFKPINDTVSDCSPYLNNKFSLYRKQIQLVTFFMTVSGSIFSLVDFIFILTFYIKAKKKLTSISETSSQYTSNRLNFNTILIFLQSICTINILLRSIEQIIEFSQCEVSSKILSITSIVLSSLITFTIIGGYFILFKFHLLINKKHQTFQELSLYSDRTSIRENLIFNKIGYVKQLLKAQNFSSRSTSLKNQTIKGLPSGYKKQYFSPNRQVIYKLCGGNKEQFQKSLQNQSKKQRNISLQEQYNTDQDQISQKKPSQKQKIILNQIINKGNLLDVRPKAYQPNPNHENLLEVTKTINVIQISMGKKNVELMQQTQKSDKDDSQIQKQQNLLKLKKINQNSKKDTTSKEKQKIANQLREEEQLRQKFNLTPNIELRKQYQNNKNWQNIDQNGNYYQVNVQKIKNKTKFLNFTNFTENTEVKDQIDPLTQHENSQWIYRKKRVAKRHQKNIQEYLKNLSKLRKQEMLCQQKDSSNSSQSLQQSQLSSQFESSSYEDQNQEIIIIEEKVQNDKLGDEKKQKVNDQGKQEAVNEIKMQKKKKLKNKNPELYLHMRKRKHFPKQNKLKLYEDQEGFYDDQNELQDSQKDSNINDQAQNDIQKIYEKGLTRQQQSVQKQKPQEKIQYKNKQNETEDGDILRFIRKKYIEAKQRREQNLNNNPKTVFEQQDQKKSNKQTKQNKKSNSSK